MKQARIIKPRVEQKTTSEKKWRLQILAVFILFLGASIIFKLYILQVARYNSYVALAENQHDSTTEIIASRGEIFLQDEGGELYPLAVNRQLQMVYAVPSEMRELDLAVTSLATILNLDQNSLKTKLGNEKDMFEILKHKLSAEEVSKIKEAKIAGVYLTPENFRYYPGGELASQLVGFVGSNGDQQKGMYGLESFWEKELKDLVCISY